MMRIAPEFSDELPLVPFCPWRCPRCQDGKPFTYGVRGRIRYHRCKACGQRYRSIMLDQSDLATYGPAGDELRLLRDLRDKLMTFVRLADGSPEADRAWSSVWEAMNSRKPSPQR